MGEVATTNASVEDKDIVEDRDGVDDKRNFFQEAVITCTGFWKVWEGWGKADRIVEVLETKLMMVAPQEVFLKYMIWVQDSAQSTLLYKSDYSTTSTAASSTDFMRDDG